MQPSVGRRIVELDGLRAVAVVAVTVFHMAAFASDAQTDASPIRDLLGNLHRVGVDIFLVISGYFIPTMLRHEYARNGRVSLKRFYARRALRILPAFLVYLTAVFLLRTTGVITLPLPDILYSLLFLANTGLVSVDGWFVGHTWTLSLQEQFYILLPLLCVVFGFRRTPLTLLLSLAFGISVVSPKVAHELSLHLAQGWLNASGLFAFRYLIVGVLIAFWRETLAPRLVNPSRAMPILLCVLLAVARIIPLHHGPLAVLLSTIEPCLWALLILWIIQHPGRIAFLCWRPVQWLGACSYSIYLWQQLFTGPSTLYHGWNPSHPIVASCAILVCATLSYYFVEQPAVALSRAFAPAVAKQ